ncbi:MAG: Holliday junction branch migration protein RuvA [Chitinophagaceae bacterium]
MIAYLVGKFSYKSPAMVIVDVHGVGYQVNISLNTYSDIQALNDGKLFTYLLVKEDAHTLYGFSEQQEKEMFVLLISVSGVGAATARMMLSNMRPAEIQRAILQGNARALEGVKGIGRKTAERLVLELRDKLNKQSFDVNISAIQGNSVEYDALDALIALGIAKPAAEQSIKKIIQTQDPGISLEDLVKKALKAI